MTGKKNGFRAVLRKSCLRSHNGYLGVYKAPKNTFTNLNAFSPFCVAPSAPVLTIVMIPKGVVFLL